MRIVLCHYDHVMSYRGKEITHRRIQPINTIFQQRSYYATLVCPFQLRKHISFNVKQQDFFLYSKGFRNFWFKVVVLQRRLLKYEWFYAIFLTNPEASDRAYRTFTKHILSIRNNGVLRLEFYSKKYCKLVVAALPNLLI